MSDKFATSKILFLIAGLLACLAALLSIWAIANARYYDQEDWGWEAFIDDVFVRSLPPHVINTSDNMVPLSPQEMAFLSKSPNIPELDISAFIEQSILINTQRLARPSDYDNLNSDKIAATGMLQGPEALPLQTTATGDIIIIRKWAWERVRYRSDNTIASDDVYTLYLCLHDISERGTLGQDYQVTCTQGLQTFTTGPEASTYTTAYQTEVKQGNLCGRIRAIRAKDEPNGSTLSNQSCTKFPLYKWLVPTDIDIDVTQ